MKKLLDISLAALVGALITLLVSYLPIFFSSPYSNPNLRVIYQTNNIVHKNSYLDQYISNSSISERENFKNIFSKFFPLLANDFSERLLRKIDDASLAFLSIKIENLQLKRSKNIEIIFENGLFGFIEDKSKTSSSKYAINLSETDRFVIDAIDPQGSRELSIIFDNRYRSLFNSKPPFKIISDDLQILPEIDFAAHEDDFGIIKFSFYHPFISYVIAIMGVFMMVLIPIGIGTTYFRRTNIDFAFKNTDKKELELMRKIISYADQKENKAVSTTQKN